MDRIAQSRITRRGFLVRAGAAAAGAAVGRPVSAAGAAGKKTRRVWAFADSHIGLVHDGKDGAEWMAVGLDDLRRNVRGIDYALALGDITDHAGAEEEIKTYVKVRAAAGLPAWYELAGNHDFGAIPAGHWARYVRKPRNYTLLDGNAAWLLISARQGKSEGRINRATGEWLKREAHRHRDKNVIVCTHQAVYRTVDGSGGGETYIMHRGYVRSIIAKVRIDLWLCGHIHGGRRNRRYVARGERTTYVNVASLNHAYGTRAANAYVLEMPQGARTMIARCRDHDRGAYLPDQEVRIEMPHPWKFGARPVLIPAGAAESRPAAPSAAGT